MTSKLPPDNGEGVGKSPSRRKLLKAGAGAALVPTVVSVTARTASAVDYTVIAYQYGIMEGMFKASQEDFQNWLDGFNQEREQLHEETLAIESALSSSADPLTGEEDVDASAEEGEEAETSTEFVPLTLQNSRPNKPIFTDETRIDLYVLDNTEVRLFDPELDLEVLDPKVLEE